MKILLLCNKIPYPAIDGGAIASLNMALSLADAGHEVKVLAMNTQKHQANAKEIPLYLRKKISFRYIEVDTRIRPQRLLLNLFFSALPYNAVRFQSKSFRNDLERLLQKEIFDLIQLEGLYLSSYMDSIRKYHTGKVAYRAHNIESDIWAGRATAEGNPLKRAYLKLIARRMFRYERSFINEYDLLLPITQADQEKFIALGNSKPAHVTLTGMMKEAFLQTESQQKPIDLFFIGALDWAPNIEGIEWFLNKVWPSISENTPDLRFHIAGRNAPSWFQQKCALPQLRFHGEIDDAHQFMDAHGIMIVPLFTGSGLRIKIVEAMARSGVIITTKTGAKGLPQFKADQLVVSDEPETWVKQIDKLIKNEEVYRKTSLAAYQYAQKNFSNEAIIKKLLNFYKQEGIC